MKGMPDHQIAALRNALQMRLDQADARHDREVRALAARMQVLEDAVAELQARERERRRD